MKRRRTSPSPAYAELTAERMLYCWNEFWTASAVWRRKDGIWSCVNPDARLAWMRGKSPEETKLELVRLGCDWKWV